MRRFLTLLAALAIAATLAVALVVVAPAAQQERTPLTANAASAAIIGLPVFSSDGKQLGKVVAEGIDEDDQPVIVAEVERPLGIAPRLAAIPTYMLVQRPDRFDDQCRGGCQPAFSSAALAVGSGGRLLSGSLCRSSPSCCQVLHASLPVEPERALPSISCAASPATVASGEGK
jgi:hypothetical protein